MVPLAKNQKQPERSFVKKAKEFQPGNVLAIAIAHLIHDIYSSFLAPILPLFLEKFNLSYTLAGFLAMVQRLPSLLNPIIGIIVDRLPGRVFIIITPAITAVSMSLLGPAPYYIVLVILLFVMGISSAFFHVPGPVLVKNVSGTRVGKGMSFYMVGAELARTLGPLVILAAVSLWGLEGTYKLIPFGILASLMVLIKLKNIDFQKDLEDNRKKTEINDTFFRLLPFFLVITGLTFCITIMKSALTTFLPTFLNIKGASLWMGGIALSILQFAGAIGTLLSGTISDKIGRKATLFIIAIATPILMWLVIELDGKIKIAVLIIMGFFMFANGPVLLALVQDVSSDHPAFVNGIYMAINFISGSVNAVIVGILSDWIGLENGFKLSALLGFGTIPFIWSLKKLKSTHLLSIKPGKNI